MGSENPIWRVCTTIFRGFVAMGSSEVIVGPVVIVVRRRRLSQIQAVRGVLNRRHIYGQSVIPLSSGELAEPVDGESGGRLWRNRHAARDQICPPLTVRFKALLVNVAALIAWRKSPQRLSRERSLGSGHRRDI